MELLLSLIILTILYGMLILSVFPEKYFRKISHILTHKNLPEHQKMSLGMPIFFSFLIGYSLAATMIYFFVF